MTQRRPDDESDGGALRDPRFDAAWRKLSREEPPPALDAAIRAAARREVGSAPRPAATHVPSALQPQRWWWPLAAAATIGAIVIGLLQLAPQDRVAPAEPSVVSDIPGASPREAPRETTAAPTFAPAAEQPRAANESSAPRAKIAPPAGPRTEASARRKDAGGYPTPAEGGTAAPRPASPAAAASGEEKATKSDAGVVAPPPLAEPFPADAAKRAAGGPAPSAKSESAGAAGALAREQAPSNAAALAKEQAAAERAPSPAPAIPPASYAPERQAQAPRDEVRSTSTSLGKARVAQQAAGQSATASAEKPMMDHPPLPVDDWIALIRKLRDKGQFHEAAKELAAFRAAHPDHERLLPPDLRDWRPPDLLDWRPPTR